MRDKLPRFKPEFASCRRENKLPSLKPEVVSCTPEETLAETAGTTLARAGITASIIPAITKDVLKHAGEGDEADQILNSKFKVANAKFKVGARSLKNQAHIFSQNWQSSRHMTL